MSLCNLFLLLLCTALVVEDVMGQTGLTESDKEAILEAHNSLRGMVEPSATNMARLVRICGQTN